MINYQHTAMEQLDRIIEQDDIKRCIIVLDAHDNYLEDEYQFERAMRFLPLNIQRRILNKRGDARNTALCNQLLQLITCSKFSKLPRQMIEFSHSEKGKPYLKNSTGLSFSMSNSDSRTAIYMKRTQGHSDVGMDMASTKDCQRWESNYLDLFQDIFSSEEYSFLRRAPRGDIRDKLFTHYWSLKEAYTKYTGTGLNCDLSRLDFGEIKAASLEEFREHISILDGKSFLFLSKWLTENSIVTVCDGPLTGSDESSSISVVELNVRTIVDNLDSMK